MLKRTAIRHLLKSLVAGVAITGTVSAFADEKDLPEAKVTPAQAREIALKAYPGKIVSQELEEESGGSGLRYSFVIGNEKAKHEVGVDAKTGAVLENSVEGENPD